MAVAPSACGAFTSAFCARSDCRATRSPFMAASATGLGAALNAFRQNTSAAVPSGIRCSRILRVLHQAGEPAGAVANAVLVNSIEVQDAQQKIPGGDGLGLIVHVAISLELAGCPADQDVRHIVVKMLVGIA